MRSTSLNDRTLWFDGDSSFDPEHIQRFAQVFDVRYVDQLTPVVEEYNRNVSKQAEITVKTHARELDLSWTMPERYKDLDVVEYLMDAHDILTDGMSADERADRELRLCVEISKYKRDDMFCVLRAIIWIINTLTANKIVWGVGRGSSVSSYVLYVIGVHDVDSYAYGLDIDDFLHE